MGKYLFSVLLLPILYPVLAYVSTSPIPGGSLYNCCIFIQYFGFAVAGLAIIAGIIMLFLENGRMLGMTLIPLSVLFFPLSTAVYEFSGTVQNNGFRAFSKRSEPLVNAINSYAKAKGNPPESLSKLVPDYLKEVPDSTGMSAYPRYQYKTKFIAGAPPDKLTWSISVPAEQSFWDLDLLYYSPTKNYSEFKNKGRPEAMGDWVIIRHMDFYFRKNPNSEIQ